ncbi:YajG family lipoprotein [Aliikangiella coralliicola]|uniref:Lipoprotein n=1 Tax=Aliikangiella coralliicola TaxID=2592383 RepID=A0A545TWA1_9GAMM|nr:YajG family lipoprotein [Aliikangiella coralliicola]TQV81482.1 hypothetical protein FLL46_25360 [Aliikangiella coralliicola]
MINQLTQNALTSISSMFTSSRLSNSKSSRLARNLSMASLVLVIAACTPAKLNYLIDPEITTAEQLHSHASLVSVQVLDKRKQLPSQKDKQVVTSAADNEAFMLKEKLVDNLKHHKFKIISKPLLADIALEFHIEQLSATVASELFKSNVEVISHLRLKAKSKGRTFEKLYKMSRSQEVANPANQNDVTGVVNQLLSKQLSGMFSDPALIELARGQG